MQHMYFTYMFEVWRRLWSLSDLFSKLHTYTTSTFQSFEKSLQERLKGATKGRKRPRSFIFIEIWGYFGCLVSICHLWVPDVRGRRITSSIDTISFGVFPWAVHPYNLTIISEGSGTRNPECRHFEMRIKRQIKQGFSLLFCQIFGIFHDFSK